MVQPLNEAYSNEVLEEFQKMEDRYNNIRILMDMRVPYCFWSHQYNIADVPIKRTMPDFAKQCSEASDGAIESLEVLIEKGRDKCQGHSKPIESFQAMLKVMKNWKVYMDAESGKKQSNANIYDIMKAQMLPPVQAFPMAMISKIESIGRAQQKLKIILDEDLLNNTSKHDPYWDSEHEVESDRLYDLRMKISCLHDNLWDLWAILKNGEE